MAGCGGSISSATHSGLNAPVKPLLMKAMIWRIRSPSADSDPGAMRGSARGSADATSMRPRLAGRQGCAESRKPGNGSGRISARTPGVRRV